MKNIIKRGTSLLLVLAMLLSFAAVVGASKPETGVSEYAAAASEKLLTVRVESAALKAGEKAYLPIYLDIKTGLEISGLQFDFVSSSSKVNISSFEKRHPQTNAFGVFAESGMPKFSSDNGYFAWASDGEETLRITNEIYGWICVTATEDTPVGGYEIYMRAHKTTTGEIDHHIFDVGLGNNLKSYDDDKVTFTPAEVIVYPANAELPTVVLTQSTFEVPKQADLNKDPNAGDVYLYKYLRIAKADENGTVKVYPVSENWLTMSKNGNLASGLSFTPSTTKLSIDPSVLPGGGGTLTVTAATAAEDPNVTFSGSADVSFTTNKEDPKLWAAGFATTNGYYKAPKEFKDETAPAYSTTDSLTTTVALNPKVFDQYGESMNDQTARVKVELFSDEKYNTLIAPDGTTEGTYKDVYVQGNNLIITNQLRKSVWCKLTAYVVGDENNESTQSVAKFKITSQYPQPSSAEIALKDNAGNALSDATVIIPGGTSANTYKVEVSKIYGTNQTVLTDAKVKNIKAALADGSALTTVSGVSFAYDAATKTGTLTVEAEAKDIENLPLKVKLKVELEDGTEVAGKIVTVVNGTENKYDEITVDKFSMAIALKPLDKTTGKPTDGTQIVSDASNSTTLPGIGETLTLKFGNVCLVDQYGDIIKDTTGKDYLSISDYKLFHKTASGDVQIPALNTMGVTLRETNDDGVTYTLVNGKDANGNLVIPEGTYYLQASYRTYTIKSAEFTLSKATGEALTYRAEIKALAADNTTSLSTAAIPHDGQSEVHIHLKVTVTDQYGTTVEKPNLVVYSLALDDVVTSNGLQINTTYCNLLPEGKQGYECITVDKDASKAFPLYGALNFVTSKDLTLEKFAITVPDGNKVTTKVVLGQNYLDQKEYNDVTTGKVKVPAIKVAQDSAFEMSKATLSVNTQTNEQDLTNGQTISVTASGETQLYFRCYDQYGRNDYYGAGVVSQSLPDGVTYTGGTYPMKFTVTSEAVQNGAEVQVKLPNKMDVQNPWTVTVKFTSVQFEVDDGAGGTKTPEVNDYLNNTAADSTYDGNNWDKVLDPKDNVKTVIAGSNDDISSKVKIVVVKKGTNPEEKVYDSSTSGEGTINDKADAGKYVIKVVYDDGTTETPIASKEFIISPQVIKVTVGGKTSKEYNGDKTLPSDMIFCVSGTGNDDVAVNPSALEFESKDVKSHKDQNTNALVIDDVRIVAIAGKSVLRGEDAGNYIANISDLTGKITQKKLDVYVEYYNKEWNGTKFIGGDAGRLADTSQVVEGDDVRVDHTTTDGGLTFTSSNVGATLVTGKESSIRATLGGTDAGNYEVGKITYNSDAKITKATLTITRNPGTVTLTGYGDDTTLENALALSGYTITNSSNATIDSSAFSSEEAPNGTLTLLTKDGTTAQRANVYYDADDYTLSLAESDNYVVSNPLDFRITWIDFTLKPDGTIRKTYDGTTDLPENAKFTFKTRYQGTINETLKVKNVEQFAFADANKGEGKTINVPAEYFEVTDGNKNPANYSVKVELTGTITAKNIENPSVTITQIDVPTYDGTQKELKFTVTDSGKLLYEGSNKDYTITSNTYTDAGDSYPVTFHGQGNYTGETTIIYGKINKAGAAVKDADLADLKATRGKTREITLDTNYPIAGTPTISVVSGSEWVNGEVTVAVTGDGKIKITLPVKNGTVTGNPKIKLTLTIPGSDNYEPTEKTFDVEVIDKKVQSDFKIVQGTSGTYSYSQGGVQLTTSGQVDGSNVKWSIAAGQQGYATVDEDSGYVTFYKPTKGDSQLTVLNQVEIVATADEAGDYAEANAHYYLTITKGVITVTASSATMTANEAVPGVSATASGLNPKDSVSNVFQTLTASVSTDGKTAGTYPVTPSATLNAGWDEYYVLTFVSGTLTVNPSASVIDTVLPIIIGGNSNGHTSGSCACDSFYDLDANRWYHEAVDWAYNLGLMNGTTKTTFSPNAAATRAQTWTMLARIAGQDTGRSVTWYEVGRTWAMGLGITDGTNPMGSLTREQLAAMLYRYVGSPAVSGTLTFVDSADVSSWARNAMLWAVQNGILDGVGGNRLNPKGTTTRAQAAAIFMRFTKLISK